MRVLLTGVSGQLGHDAAECLERTGAAFLGVSSKELDVTDREAVLRLFAAFRPDAALHCAAWTKVDQAEDEAAQCLRVNANGTRNLAEACRESGAKLLYVSTDYVFPGTGTRPWEVDDAPGPLNVYGRSKLEGERAVRELLDRYFIVRTSWVMGAHGQNFIKTMLRLAREHRTLRVVDDQIGSPTFTADLAPLLCGMLETERFGVYHATNEGYCSWAELAERCFRLAGRDVRVERIKTEDYPARAVRPKNSRLSKRSLDEGGFARLPDWESSLARLLKEETMR